MTLEALIEQAVERSVRRVLVEMRLCETGRPEMLTVEDAAELAQVSVATIRRWIAEGKLKRYGSKGAVRVRREDVLQVRPDEEPKNAKEIVDQLLGGR